MYPLAVLLFNLLVRYPRTIWKQKEYKPSVMFYILFSEKVQLYFTLQKSVTSLEYRRPNDKSEQNFCKM